jgi:hypothetical protein
MRIYEVASFSIVRILINQNTVEKVFVFSVEVLACEIASSAFPVSIS